MRPFSFETVFAATELVQALPPRISSQGLLDARVAPLPTARQNLVRVNRSASKHDDAETGGYPKVGQQQRHFTTFFKNILCLLDKDGNL
jgi:hypothetical protein